MAFVRQWAFVAATSALARQIEGDAPADIFISADLVWMAYLAERELTRADRTTNLLGNRIVLVALTGTAQAVEITLEFDLVGMLIGGPRLELKPDLGSTFRPPR